MTARSPDGRTWTIKRHWLSLRPRWRGGSDWGVVDVGDPSDLLDDGPFAFVLGIVAFALLALFLFPVFAILIEILIAVVALSVTLGAKILFRRPWIVDAIAPGEASAPMRWKVVGWRRSHEVMNEIRAALEAGRGFLSPHAEPIEPAPVGAESDIERAAPKGGS